ncbi:MAG TPA: NAD(P)-dependent oxidoreductase, partial [Candidatus Sulfotelmatobacter sp.]|nr:NAD(P)-dependent oxidoreductase [Candidatus Sulfotelmatobacter sp.]
MADGKPVGIVGLGLLGSAVAEVLLPAGYVIVGYDVLPERLAALAVQGGKPATSAADVARQAGPIFTVLPTLTSVEQAIAGPDGVLGGAGPDSILLQMSTISPGLAVRMEAVARARGVAFLDTPVSGTSGMVARREGVITVGGDRGAYERCRPLLEALAKRVYHVGACGMGSHLKLVANLIMGLNTMVLAEGLTLARRAGLDPAQTLEILAQGAAASKMLEV